VVNVAYWRCGENDSPAPSGTFGPANATAIDSTGNGWNLTGTNTTGIGGGPFYAYPGDYPAGVGLPAGSTVDYAFDKDGNNAFTRNTAVTVPDLSNWGMQAYVRPNTTDGLQTYLVDGAGSGFALFQCDGSLLGLASGVRYFAEVTGRADIDTGVSVDTSAWHNLALVDNNGTAQVYVDSVLKASVYVGAAEAPQGFLGMGSGAGGNFYSGGIDEARIFTFAPGAFQVSDLNNYVGVVPEPGTVTLLATGLFGMLAYAWRSRKQ
jgi:hypothetical protein